jgi:hypothetical protein
MSHGGVQGRLNAEKTTQNSHFLPTLHRLISSKYRYHTPVSKENPHSEACKFVQISANSGPY